MSDILLNSKAQKPFLLSTFPSNSMGSNGNLAISTISNKGVYLSVKSNGRWHTVGKMEDLKRAENTSTQKLTLNTLNVGKQLNIANLAEIVANAMKVSSSSISIDFDTNIELNGENVNNNANLNVSGLETIKSETVLTENLMDNPQLNIKYDDNNYVKIGTIETGGLQIEPYKIDDIDGKTIGPIKIMYDGDNYASLQVSDTGNLTIAPTGSDSSITLDAEVSVILNAESRDVILNSGRNIELDSNGDIEINADGGNVEIKDGSDAHFSFNCDSTTFTIYDDTNVNDYFKIVVEAEGLTTIGTVDADTAVGHLVLQPDGNLILDPVSTKVIINATDQLYFDGGGDTYIREDSADSLQIIVGGDIMLQFVEGGTSGNSANFRSDTCVGFARKEATFSATGIIGSGGTDDTDIDFRFCNKYRLEMTGDITTINLIFPAMSGNFLLVCPTNGDHDVTNWKVYTSDGSSAASTTDVMWAGGSVPAFTSSGIDIVSFYWDANEQQAYGTASLAFATP